MYNIGFRQAAVKMYEYFRNMKTVAMALNIGVATIWRWIRHGVVPKVRADAPSSKFTDTMMAFVKETFAQNNYLNLNDLQRLVFDTFSIKVSRQCMAHVVTKLGLSRKRLHNRGFITKVLLIARYTQFVKEYRQLKSRGIRIIATDEFGVDKDTLPIYGYSLKGFKAFCQTSPKRSKRVSVIMAIDQRNASLSCVNRQYKFRTVSKVLRHITSIFPRYCYSYG